MQSAALPGDDEVLDYLERLSNHHLWPIGDELGALNFITPTKIVSAAGLVRSGRQVSCARRLRRSNAIGADGDFLHFMMESGENWQHSSKVSASRAEMAKDFIALEVHGANTTHMDALGHFVRENMMYGGAPADAISTNRGATRHSIESAGNGIVSRGVLLDIASLHGVSILDASHAILPHELCEAEQMAGIAVGRGDVVLVRTGLPNSDAKRSQRQSPGLHAACLPWLHEREVSVIFSDSWTDVMPSGLTIDLPVHRIAELAMGVRCMDSGDFEALSIACKEENRWEFMICFAPLRLEGATGSPLNPLAIF